MQQFHLVGLYSVDKSVREVYGFENQLKADVKHKKIAFFDVKNYHTELKRMQYEYYKDSRRGDDAKK